MALLKDDAVVLRRLDYSETSQIVVMLARTHGKIRLIAKGIKRSTKTRFATAIDLLELGHVVWSSRPDRQRSLSPLTEWKQFNAFVGLRSSLSRLYTAQYAAEITYELTADEDPHPQLFDALVEYLKAVTLADEPLVPLCDYLRVVLIEIGLMLRGDMCAGCRRPLGRGPLSESHQQRLYCSSHEGGLLCRNCEPAQVEKRLVNLHMFESLASGQITDSIAIEAFDLLNYHISHIMHREPLLAEFVVPATRRRCLGGPEK